MRSIPALLAGVLATAPAVAGERAAEDIPAPVQPGYIVTMGGFGDLEPRFEGARHYRWGFQPLFDIRKEGTREWLNLPRDGFDFAFVETQNFRMGAVASGRWERDVSGIVRGYRHVGPINLSVEAGGFAEWWPSALLRTRVEARDAVVGAKGVVGDLSADLVLHPLPQWTVTGGPRLSIADASFMRSYYSIDSQQSATSGLPTYSAPPGLRTVGAGSMIKYKWSDSVSTMAFVEYERIAAAAFDSPLISTRGSPNQTTVGLGMSLSFVAGK